MTKAELQELRALLRTQAEAEAARPATSLRERLARPFRRPSTTPVSAPARVEAVAVPVPAAPAPALAEADELLLAAPAPRRAHFGLASDEPRSESAAVEQQPAVEAPRPAPLSATDVFLARINRPGAAPTPAADAEPIGADELLELQDLLAERLPGLLAQLDGAPAPVLEALQPEPARVPEPTWEAEQDGTPEPTPRSRPRLKLYAVPTEPSVLADLHASLAAEHAALDHALQACAPAEPPAYYAEAA